MGLGFYEFRGLGASMIRIRFWGILCQSSIGAMRECYV